MKLRYIAIALAGVGLLATPALANKVQQLGTGGNTLGGPAKVAMGSGETVTIMQGLDQIGNPQICVTVQVGTKSGAVQLDLVEASTVSIQVPAGGSGTLCGDADRVDLTCTGGSCAPIWRADKV